MNGSFKKDSYFVSSKKSFLIQNIIPSFLKFISKNSGSGVGAGVGSVTFVPRTYKVQVLDFSVLASNHQSGRDNGFLFPALVSPWVSPRVAPRVSHYTLGFTQGESSYPVLHRGLHPGCTQNLGFTQGCTQGETLGGVRIAHYPG